MSGTLDDLPTTATLLDECKALIAKDNGLDKPISDYRLAKVFGWKQQRISLYRTGRRALDDEAAQQVAECLNYPLETVLACMMLERARRHENDTVTAALERLCHRVAMAGIPYFVGFWGSVEIGRAALSL